MRALVISGGGSKGAYAGGVAQHLIEEQGHKYDLFLGTSTGSLLISQLANNNIKRAYEVYTQVNQNTIFNVNPYYKFDFQFEIGVITRLREQVIL